MRKKICTDRGLLKVFLANLVRPLCTILRCKRYSLVAFHIAPFATVSESFFTISLGNVYERGGTILSPHAASLFQQIGLRFCVSTRLTSEMVSVLKHSWRTIASGLMSYLRMCCITTTDVSYRQSMSRRPELFNWFVPDIDRFGRIWLRTPRSDVSCRRIARDVCWLCVLIHCLQKVVFVETQPPK